MTVEITTGAVSHEPVGGWHSIDWQAAHENVRRLQARIVKATQAGKWGKVKALQRLLTHSYRAKALAVKRVTENQGKRTSGVDGKIWETPEKKAKAVGALRQRGYRPLPLRRIYIDKDNGKKRPLGIPTMYDRAMQALYLLALEPIAETTADPNSYGFRPERGTADTIQQAFIVLSWQRSAEWILEADIKSCFDRISHEWLLAHIPIDKVILQKWLKAGYMEKSVLQPTEDGTPQGGIISPVLANLALDGLERILNARYPKNNRKGKKAKVNLIRYADDFIITGSSKELLEEEVKPIVETFLKERGLELSAEKTHITHIVDGFDFLGQNVRKYDGKLLIKPSKKSIKKLMDKVRKIIKDNKQAPAGLLIALLNPVLRGWGLYHRHVVCTDVFSKVDFAVFRALWRWAGRRHPNKGKRWRRRKYFKTVGTHNWVFFGDHRGKEHILFRVGSIHYEKYVKVQLHANPFDVAWETYFEQRLDVKMVKNLRGRRQLIRLWKEQNGLCPICNQKITKLTGWHSHHIIWRSLGGADTTENRVLLHPNCHSLVHSQQLTVEKPRPTQRGARKA